MGDVGKLFEEFHERTSDKILESNMIEEEGVPMDLESNDEDHVSK
ncbi:23008_t:CDS:2, partial [Dentiscutata erythropus]